MKRKKHLWVVFWLKHPITFLLIRTYGLEEDGVWQISRLLFSSWPSWYLIYSEPPCLPGLCSRGHYGFEEEIAWQDGCLMHGHLWYLNGMIWAIQALHFALVSAQDEYTVWKKKILQEVLKTAAMVAQHNDSASCESTIPSLMPYKLSHCALQICRWFLNFEQLRKVTLLHSVFKKYTRPKPFYTYWYYTTRQHTKTLFCGEIIFQYL